MTQPTVTVLIPVYNEAEYLLETLQSVQAQSYDNFLCIIGDNASSDATQQIYTDFCQSDARFSAFRQRENRGTYHNTVALIKRVKTPYMMLFAGHDLIQPSFLQQTLQVLETQPEVSMAFSYVVAQQGESLSPLPQAVYNFTGDSASRYLQSAKQLKNCTIAQSVVRTQALADFNFARQPYIGFDHVLISHLLWYGKLHYVPEYLYHRRYFEQHAGAYSSRITGQGDQATRDYRDMFLAYMEDFHGLKTQQQLRQQREKLVQSFNQRQQRLTTMESQEALAEQYRLEGFLQAILMMGLVSESELRTRDQQSQQVAQSD
uniref:Putative GT2: distantly related to b-1, 4-galactosyltransferase n=1 Tax=Magnetococcus massalia (strain MO-1) TaxID=451514 RepID=A0A1S7LLE6_MAGMO|nr:putative GT2 : distantly related to b-1, 4-galactosyltransferase [Candidatus Magnetococcus massalia]